MAGRFSVESVFKAVDRVTAPVTRMQNRVGKFMRTMERGARRVNRAWSGINSKIRRAGRVLAAGALLLGGSGTVMAQAGIDFEQAITNVGAVALQTRDEIQPLESLAKRLGATTQFTATQSANAMEVLARAGFNMNQIMEATPAVLSAAAASGLEIAEVADHVSNVLKGLGLDMDQAGRVADVLALASARTNSSIGSLGESMRNVASTARSLGVPLESVVASVALLQDVGLDASVAGSAMNVMLTKMAAPSKGLERKMRKLGISFKDARGDMLPFEQVLAQLSKASEKAGGNFDKVAFLAELVGLRGQKAAANLADLFDSGKVAALTAELRKAIGAADRMARIRMDTTHGSLLLLGSAIDAVKVKLFDMNSGPLKNTIDLFTKWVGANEDLMATKLSDWINSVVENMPAIWEWTKRIGKALLVFYVVGAVLKTVAAALTLISLIMAANPVTLIILGIVAAATALAGIAHEIRKNWEPIRELFSGWGRGIRNFFDDDDGDDGEDTGEARPRRNRRGRLIVSPQSRTAAAISENNTTTKSEVTIRDETGRAEVTGAALPSGVALEPMGGF